MRFGLKSIIALAILYRAILLSQGGSGAAALSTQLADAVPTTQARVRDEIADRIGAHCKSDPAACFANAARLTTLVAPAADGLSELRHSRHGAMAAGPR